MIVTVASVPDASDSDLQDPLVKVFYDQLELELVAQRLVETATFSPDHGAILCQGRRAHR